MDGKGIPAACQSLLTQKIPGFALVGEQHPKSAQQVVLILRFQPIHAANPDDLDSLWSGAMTRGRNRLVLRIWQSGAGWWNLHRNHQTLQLASSEVWGYQMAGEALRNSRIRVPAVLHFDCSDANMPWALFEFVGKDSTLFDESEMDEKWMRSMVPTRYEFGFNEPHPRWGRVPEDDSLEYAMMIVKEVVVPIHEKTSQLVDVEKPPTNFEDMVKFYDASIDDQLKPMLTVDCIDSTLISMIHEVEGAVIKLKKIQPSQLSPVLVHMDLQPQNLLFNRVGCISSVLDWEESAWADPRFDLLLICRKVTANRQQAERVWQLYMEQRKYIDLGPLQSWLFLETIHSIVTLLLQVLNLLEGGRSPWEKETDLRMKLDREFFRLREHSPKSTN